MSETIVSSIEDINSALSEPGRTVILFTAPAWCGPCRAFKPHWARAVENVDDINFLYVDVDNVPDASVDYAVRSVPTVMLFEDGQYVRNIVAPQGALPFIADIRS